MLKPKVGILIVFTIGASGWESISVHSGSGEKQEGNITETHGKPKETIAVEIK